MSSKNFYLVRQLLRLYDGGEEKEWSVSLDLPRPLNQSNRAVGLGIVYSPLVRMASVFLTYFNNTPDGGWHDWKRYAPVCNRRKAVGAYHGMTDSFDGNVGALHFQTLLSGLSLLYTPTCGCQ